MKFLIITAAALLAFGAGVNAQDATVPAIVERARSATQESEARRVALEYLSGQVEQVIVRLGEIESENGALRTQKATLEHLLAEVMADHRSLEQTLATTTEEKQHELDVLHEQLASITAELDRERSRRNELRGLSDRLQTELDATSSAHTALERAFKTSDQQANKQLGDLRHQLAALTVELENERTIRHALARQGNTLAETVAALSQERLQLENDLKNTRAVIDDRDGKLHRQRAEIALLSDQVAALRADLKSFKVALATGEGRAKDQDETNEELGRRLNAALAAQVRELAKYRSEFFGRLRDVLGGRSDVLVAGDRFVLQSELLFASGSAQIGRTGRRELIQLATALKGLAALIPDDVDWILRIDGHTDRVPIVTTDFASNWELSTARAVSVVEFLVEQGIPPDRLAATGFGEFQPLDDRRDEIAYRRNRRIEFKLTQH